MDLVSIITPVYKSGLYISETIQSVLNQKYSNWELLLIDDCSPDNSSQIIKSFMENDSRIKYTRLKKNSGPAIARNIGIEKANGTYIAFLDSDDNWYGNKLSEQIHYMKENNYAFTFTDYIIRDESTNRDLPYLSRKNRVTYSDEIKFNFIATSTVVFNQHELGKLFMPDIRNRQDWALWIRILEKTDAAWRLDKKLTLYYRRKDSISSNKLKLIKYHWFIFNSFLDYNRIKSLWMLIRNIFMHINNQMKKL
jgi:teichuronic acid biosynthesis glycosyltransferase TuaG